MATLFITEFSDIAAMNGWPQMAKTPPVASQTVAIAGVSAASAAFGASTKFIRVHTDVICSIKFIPTPGAAPTAAATDARMAANQTEFFGVAAGDKLAVISNT